MKSEKLSCYILLNVLTEKWWNDANQINNKIFNYINCHYEKHHFNALKFDVEQLLLYSDSIYENQSIKDWFKHFVEEYIVLLLWVIQESEKDLNKKILLLYQRIL